MNSISVRVCHGTEPDTKILMKLSSFSHPICDMTQIIIDPDKEKNIDKVVDKLFNIFINDGMKYNLKVYSDILMFSNEFSKKFAKEQFYGDNNSVFRMESHRNISEYSSNLKISSGKIIIEDGGELTQQNFYEIMSKNAPFIAQRILERKINKINNLKENEEIIDYFKETELYFENKNKNNLGNNSEGKQIKINKQKIYELFKEINENNDVYLKDPTQLSEYITKVRVQTNGIIKINQIEFETENNDKYCYKSDFCIIY